MEHLKNTWLLALTSLCLAVVLIACADETLDLGDTQAAGERIETMTFRYDWVNYAGGEQVFYSFDCWDSQEAEPAAVSTRLHPSPSGFPGPCTIDYDDANGENAPTRETFFYSQSKQLLYIDSDDGIDGPDGLVDSRTEFSYGDAGELLSGVLIFYDETGREDSRYDYAYEWVDGVLEERLNLPETQNNRPRYYRYDGHGNLLRYGPNDQDGPVWTYSYDVDGTPNGSTHIHFLRIDASGSVTYNEPKRF